MTLKPGKVPAGDVLIYEYGVRLDAECVPIANEQIFKARLLYNALVALIGDTVKQMNAFVLESGPKEGRDLQAQIDALNAQFDAARAKNDEEAMKVIAQQRREVWPKLWEVLSATRKALRPELSKRFFSRIGKNSKCDTYRLRSAAVNEGLGWATANAVLDAALQAFSKSITKGRGPRFAKGADKVQDTLSLQFTTKGGVAANVLLEGRHGELGILPEQGSGRRCYGELRFRLGAAKAGTNATGTWQYHRPLPEGCHVGLARLVRRRIGKDTKWALQLMLKLARPLAEEHTGTRAHLVAVHMGWAADLSGRRVAGISDGADPGMARLVQLPYAIEEALDRSAALLGERDTARDQLVPQLKAIEARKSWPEELTTELAAIKKLPTQHIAVRRIHRLCYQLREADALPEWLDTWRKEDRLRWQSATHGARRARNARRDFYRNLAIDLARSYDTLLIEPIDLAGAAEKIDPQTGERSEFAKKARAGRVVAALYEFESALRWAAAKCGSAVLELIDETASRCAICEGSAVRALEDDYHTLECSDCGARVDRKLNGAAVAWAIGNAGREEVVSEFWLNAETDRAARAERKKEKADKQAEGRRAAREASAQGKAEGFAPEQDQ